MSLQNESIPNIDSAKLEPRLLEEELTKSMKHEGQSCFSYQSAYIKNYE